jgi:hypothetical protein
MAKECAGVVIVDANNLNGEKIVCFISTFKSRASNEE